MLVRGKSRYGTRRSFHLYCFARHGIMELIGHRLSVMACFGKKLTLLIHFNSLILEESECDVLVTLHFWCIYSKDPIQFNMHFTYIYRD